MEVEAVKKFNTIQEGIEEIRQGRMLVVVDDEDRENEGDLVMAARKRLTSWLQTAGG